MSESDRIVRRVTEYTADGSSFVELQLRGDDTIVVRIQSGRYGFVEFPCNSALLDALEAAGQRIE